MSEIKGRVLAIDYGTKRIGLALSDEHRILARPIGIIERTNRSHKEILELISKEGVTTVILGLPRSLDGSDSTMTTEVRAFADLLFKRLDAIGIGHQFHDERLTSMIAAENLRESGLSKSKRQEKYRHDEEAARIILQEFLDSKH